MEFSEWLEAKYKEWAKQIPSRNSYYDFARYLDIPHSSFSLYTSGTLTPTGEDLHRLAEKLGSEIYEITGQAAPGVAPDQLSESLQALPRPIRLRLINAVTETATQIRQKNLNPDSLDAKRLAMLLFEKWGFRLSG